ncbi:MAG TPA: hypothetical protein VIB47_11035, partial [Dehalococcoidia bacterium]
MAMSERVRTTRPKTAAKQRGQQDAPVAEAGRRRARIRRRALFGDLPAMAPRAYLAEHLRSLHGSHGNQFIAHLARDDSTDYDPDAAERLFLDGESHFKNGNFAMAIILWERVRQIPGAPDDVRNPILFNIGLA